VARTVAQTHQFGRVETIAISLEESAETQDGGIAAARAGVHVGVKPAEVHVCEGF
jgi:hypothetical protein